MTTMMLGYCSPDRSTTTEDIMDERKKQNQMIQIIFRFVHGQNLTLSVNPDTEIRHVIKPLLQKSKPASQKASKEEKCLVVSSQQQQSIDSSTRTSDVGGTLTTKEEKNALAFLSSWYYWWQMTMMMSLSSSDQFTFVWNGKVLDEDNTWNDYLLYYYNNNNTSRRTSSKTMATVFVSQKQYGGCFMVSASILGLICMSIISSMCTCGLSLTIIPFLLPLLFILPLFCL